MKTIVHISKTPLVAAPARLASVLRDECGYDAIHFYENDYPDPLKGLFIHDSMRLQNDDQFTFELFDDYLRRADIIHIHNQCTFGLEERIIKLNPSAKFVYHVHSPLREGPLYFLRMNDFRFKWSAFCVVGQFHPRLYPDARPMPNIIPDEPSAMVPKSNYAKILYSPSHRRAGRWGTKVSKSLDKALSTLTNSGIDIHNITTPVTPQHLLKLRRWSNITIDEISTGGFHQISLEGLICGNAVVNGADEFSLQMIMGWTNSKRRPPFVILNERQVEAGLQDLVNNLHRLQEINEESLSYAKEFLQPDVLIQRYEELYDSLN